MYDKKETDISYKYLKSIISKLDEPIIIIGGWATYFTVNKNYKKEFGVNYIGSRDVDLGFNTVESFKETSSILEKDGFEFISFRYLKEISYETGKELTKKESMTIPIYNIFSMYVDLVISETDSKLEKKLGFVPIDEPLIKLVFANKKHRTELIEFRKKLWLPSPDLLLTTKINAIVNRTKDHKRVKDYCDIIAICLYSQANTNNLVSFVKENAIKERIIKLKEIINQEELKQVSNILRIDIDIINNVINKLVR
jgi:hypothetical protein